MLPGYIYIFFVQQEKLNLLWMFVRCCWSSVVAGRCLPVEVCQLFVLLRCWMVDGGWSVVAGRWWLGEVMLVNDG